MASVATMVSVRTARAIVAMALSALHAPKLSARVSATALATERARRNNAHAMKVTVASDAKHVCALRMQSAMFAQDVVPATTVFAHATHHSRVLRATSNAPNHVSVTVGASTDQASRSSVTAPMAGKAPLAPSAPATIIVITLMVNVSLMHHLDMISVPVAWVSRVHLVASRNV